MKKLLLIPALLSASIALADTKKYEVSPMIGYNFAEHNLEFKDNGYFTGGLEVQYNKPEWYVNPEISLFYAKPDYKDGADTAVTRLAVNGVKDYSMNDTLSLFAKAGLGYEFISDSQGLHDGSENRDSAFVDAGVGAKMAITENVALKLESIYMLKHNNSTHDNNVMLLAGLSFAFGGEDKKEAPVVAPVDGDDDKDGVLNSIDKCPTSAAGAIVDASGCLVDGDDDKDGVLNSVDKCPATITGTKVDATGCMIDGDDDNDGVLNSVDKCKETVAGTSVDTNGCAAEINLHINFENGSFKVDEASKVNITKASNFMKNNPNYSVEILGYTDSVGNKSSNQRLSQKRADVVKNLILKESAVDASRLSATGMGEVDPVADNATVDGRAQNRRIEAKLSHK